MMAVQNPVGEKKLLSVLVCTVRMKHRWGLVVDDRDGECCQINASVMLLLPVLHTLTIELGWIMERHDHGRHQGNTDQPEGSFGGDDGVTLGGYRA